jgi:hypothetical protein
VIAPEASAAFVANMEDVLEVYHRPRDPKRPLVCLDRLPQDRDDRRVTTTNTNATA